MLSRLRMLSLLEMQHSFSWDNISKHKRNSNNMLFSNNSSSNKIKLFNCGH